MRPRSIWLLLSLVALVTVARPARTATPWASDPATPVVTHNQMLRASLDRIAAGSGLWREVLGTLEGSGRRAIVLTPDQVRVQDARDAAAGAFEADLLAEAAPVVQDGSVVRTVLVVVNLALLRQAHHARVWASPADFARDLDRIVIHEVYGHAFPYLLAGDLSGRCADAQPGQRPTDACAIQRENAVRAELRLGLRRDVGLDGLALARPTGLSPRLPLTWVR
ncbi:MAG: hypothetical protein HOP14_02110 [Acidobacteria bacterium]|nr:hypothetical protein [Acidobacteriota bacterium]